MLCGRLENTLWVRIGLLAVGLMVATGLSWLGMFAAAQGERHLWGVAGLAYTFGLRHGLDADHITAVDNVTRKLVAEGQSSVLVGMWFSVGHCSLVVIACLILFAISQSLEDNESIGMKIADIVGGILASTFLLLIGLMNLLILIQIGGQIRKLRKEKLYVEQSWDEATSKGLIAYCAKPLYKIVDRPWKMLIVGIVFGFGFDTVVSVTVLTTTANNKMDATVFQGLMLSLVFSCGLVALDSADGVLMLITYSWAALSPVRKVYFNFLITAIAVGAAFFVGMVILLQLIADHTDCTNGFCEGVRVVGEHFEYIGLGLVVAFALAWAGGWLYYHYGGLLELEKEIKVVDKLGRPVFDEAGVRILYALSDCDEGDAHNAHTAHTASAHSIANSAHTSISEIGRHNSYQMVTLAKPRELTNQTPTHGALDDKARCLLGTPVAGADRATGAAGAAGGAVAGAGPTAVAGATVVGGAEDAHTTMATTPTTMNEHHSNPATEEELFGEGHGDAVAEPKIEPAVPEPAVPEPAVEAVPEGVPEGIPETVGQRAIAASQEIPI